MSRVQQIAVYLALEIMCLDLIILDIVSHHILYESRNALCFLRITWLIEMSKMISAAECGFYDSKQ